MKKRQPRLCDLLLSTPPMSVLPKAFVESTMQGVREAKRFVLDDEAALLVAEMIRDMPRVIADAQDFAIPPFTKMWIEFPFKRFWETITGRAADIDTDTQIGFLIMGTIVREVMMADGEYPEAGLVGIMPLEYHLHHPLSFEEELAFCARVGTSRGQLDYLFWGESALQFYDPQTAPVADNKEALKSLRRNHGFHMYPMKPGIPDRVIWDQVIMRSGGSLRNLIAILLFLNRTRDMQVVVDVPHQQTMIGRKPGVLLRHSVIRLSLSPKPRLLTLVPGQGLWRRMHDVRGHFCHNARAREAGHLWCAHEWEETAPLHWHCIKCDGQRWWRKEHKRGHEDKGLVTSEYDVVA